MYYNQIIFLIFESLFKNKQNRRELDRPYILMYTTPMNKPSFTLSADLLLNNNNLEFLSNKKIQLLENITIYGSISKAAKESEITYKTAWSWLDKMNAQSPKPLVQKISGGKDGGGTVVTAYAKELMCVYEDVRALHQKHLYTLEASFSHLEDELQSPLFAFSKLQTSIKEIVIKGDKAIFSLELFNGDKISAQAPRSFVEVHDLTVGSSLSALIESDTVSVSKVLEEEISSRNKLIGTVSEIVITEDVLLTLQLRGDQYLTARITYKSFKDMGIKVGDKLTAVFKAYSVTVFKS